MKPISEMSGAELTRACATQVMEWVEGTDFLHEIYGPQGQFSGIWILLPDPPLVKEEWQPLHRPDHWMMVEERMRELGWETVVYFTIEGIIITMLKGVDFYSYCEGYEKDGKFVTYRYENINTTGRAILEVALKPEPFPHRCWTPSWGRLP